MWLFRADKSYTFHHKLHFIAAVNVKSSSAAVIGQIHNTQGRSEIKAHNSYSGISDQLWNDTTDYISTWYKQTGKQLTFWFHLPQQSLHLCVVPRSYEWHCQSHTGHNFPGRSAGCFQPANTTVGLNLDLSVTQKNKRNHNGAERTQTECFVTADIYNLK